MEQHLRLFLLNSVCLLHSLSKLQQLEEGMLDVY